MTAKIGFSILFLKINLDRAEIQNYILINNDNAKVIIRSSCVYLGFSCVYIGSLVYISGHLVYIFGLLCIYLVLSCIYWVMP
jgi:hypothetical protein